MANKEVIPYRYKKDVLSLTRDKPYQRDEVTAEIQTRIRKQALVDRSKIAGKILMEATESMIRTPSMLIYSKQTGKKTHVQQLAENVEIPENLPKLPPYLQIFAFRYATEVRKHVDWAAIFHVSFYTIRYWLLKKDVMQYILKLRQERVYMMSERVALIENKALDKLDEIFKLPVNDDNIESMRKVILDSLSIARHGEPRSIDQPQIAVNIENNNSVEASSRSISGSVAVSSIADIKDKIAELEMLEDETRE